MPLQQQACDCSSASVNVLCMHAPECFEAGATAQCHCSPAAVNMTCMHASVRLSMLVEVAFQCSSWAHPGLIAEVGEPAGLQVEALLR